MKEDLEICKLCYLLLFIWLAHLCLKPLQITLHRHFIPCVKNFKLLAET